MALSISCSERDIVSSNSSKRVVNRDDTSSHPKGLYAILGGGLVVRLLLAWAPVAWLLETILPDDAFYYFTIARNISRGGAPSFDGVNLTNGFHPLWTAVLLPIFSSISDRLVAIHAALTICALLDTLSIALVFELARRVGAAKSIALLAAAAYAFSPVVTTTAGGMNGLETGLNSFVILVYLLSYVDLVQKRRIELAGALYLGAVAGLLLLARTDNVVLLGVTSLHLLFTVESRSRRRLLAAVPVVLAITAPWLLWSQLQFGSFVQSSGRSIAFFSREYFTQSAWGLGDYARWIGENLLRLAHYFPIPVLSSFSDPMLGGALAFAVVIVLAWWLRLWQRESWRNASPIAIEVALVIAVTFLLYITTQTVRTVVMRTWYYAPFVPVGYALLAGVLSSHIERFRSAPLWKPALLVLALGYIWASSGLIGISGGGRDLARYRLALHINAEGTKGVIGAWNAGVLGYVVEGARVVDLDGVVNNSIIPHIRAHRLGDYCRESGINYLADDLGSMRVWSGYWSEDSTSIIDLVQPLYDIPLSDARDTLRFGTILIHY
jgi:hypothetical protein